MIIPYSDMASSPVIVMGMHRSGTSLLSKILQDMGMWIGGDLSPNSESLFFQECNIRFLNRFGGKWNKPNAFLERAQNSGQCKEMALYYKELLTTERFQTDFLKGKQTEQIGLWGWKDPRNTLMIPVFKQVFNDFKIIHIRRHGVDVASSLIKRNTARHQLRHIIQALKGHNNIKNKDSAVRISSFKEALLLWDTYLEAFYNSIRGIENQVLDLTFENLTGAPEKSVEKIRRFLQIEKEPFALKREIQDRGNSYKQSPKTQSVAMKNKDLLQKWGY